MWLALGAAAWMARRARRRPPSVVWSGRLEPGESVMVRAWVPGQAQPAPPAS